MRLNQEEQKAERNLLVVGDAVGTDGALLYICVRGEQRVGLGQLLQNNGDHLSLTEWQQYALLIDHDMLSTMICAAGNRCKMHGAP
jgi:hypothetical protein